MEIKNLDKLMKKLDKLAKVELIKPMQKATKDVQTTAKTNVPVDDGHLRNSISTRVLEDDKGVEGTVFTNVEYAPYIEFGTGPMGAKNNKGISPNVDVSYRSDSWVYFNEKWERWVTTEGMVAQPFLYPALKSRKEVVRQYFIDYINVQIGKVAGDR